MTQLPNIHFGGNDTPFKGVNEITQPERLTPGELVLLENIRLDSPVGVASTRKGFSKYNSNQVDAAGNINSLFDVQDVDGNDYLLAAIGTKLRKSTNGTGVFSDLKTGLTNNLKMRMSILGSNRLFTNGVDPIFYTTDLSTIQNLKINKPDTTLMTVVPHYGSSKVLTEGYYQYVVVYFTVDGQKSNVSVPVITTQTSLANTDYIALGSLPVSSDSRIISKRIYRTLANELEKYYLLTSLDNAITSFTDNIPDNNLDTTETIEYTNVPDTAKYTASNADRILLANLLKTYENRVIPIPHISYGDTSYIASDTSTGNLAAGLYDWAYTYVDVNDNESELVYFISDTIGANKEVLFQNFPLPVTSCILDNFGVATAVYFNTTIKYVRFYRSKVGGAGPFDLYYYVGDYIANTYFQGNTFLDNLNDSSLGAVYPKGGHGSIEQVKLGSSIIFSNINTFLEYPELNYIEIYPDDEDEITGIFDDDNGIVVFKQRSICKLYTNGDPSNWQATKLVTNKGCDQPDSIYKQGSSYFFVFENQVYIFNGQSADENISYKRKITFDSVTSFLGSTFWNNSLWYILTVQIGSNYFLLCYDTKLKTWYKFSISKADTIIKKEFGADAGKLLIGGNLYVTTYNENQIYDNDTGDKQDILVQLKTGDRSIDDFIRMRLMFFFVNYTRLHGTLTNQIIFTLTDPKINASINYTDTYDADDQLIWRIATDGMQGRLRRTNKVNFSIYGYALSEFLSSRLDYNAETWGNHFKHPQTGEGLGMNTGTKTGINQ